MFVTLLRKNRNMSGLLPRKNKNVWLVTGKEQKCDQSALKTDMYLTYHREGTEKCLTCHRVVRTKMCLIDHRQKKIKTYLSCYRERIVSSWKNRKMFDLSLQK